MIKKIISLFLLFCFVIILFFSIFYFKPIKKPWNTINLVHLLNAKANSKNGVTFAVLGDSQINIFVFKKILHAIDQDPDIQFVIHLGDLVHSGNEPAYLFILNLIQRNLHKPFLMVVGNHELRGGGLSLYKEFFGRDYFAFRLGKTCFFMANNAANDLGPSQRLWLRKSLKEAQSCRLKLLFMHKPLFDPRKGYEHSLPRDQARALLTSFRKYGVDHIFCAHVHGFFQGAWGGIPYTITGGAGARLYGKDPQHFFYHYLKVSLKEGELYQEVKGVHLPGFQGLERFYGAFLKNLFFVRYHLGFKN